MASWQARLAAYMVRRRVKPALGDMSDIGKVRSVFATRLPSPSGVRYRPATLGGVPGEWVEADAPGTAACTLLYLHGGGFVGCSPQTHRPLTAALALQGMRLFVPDYRLAPEHPFPAALDDVRAAWDALRADVAADGAGRLAVAGDSAGGNLALALMLSLRDAGQPLPDAAALFSPSTDLTGASPSLLANAARDAMFDGAALGRLADAYLAGGDPAQALASPLLADLAGLPPLLVHVGENEVLRDDGLRLADKARAAGVQIELAVFDVVPHVWQLFWRLPEAKRSVREAARFLCSAGGPDNVPVEDVIIVGAGLSGIGAACHLQTRCPGKRVLILEGRESMGGTWDLFRYPGVRSDSDMYTLGYAFRPWTQGKAIADGPAILDYIRDTARAYGVDRKIRYGQQVKGARWSTADACWTLDVAQPDGRVIQMRCNFLFMCAGYYRYAEGYRPEFPGEERYAGRIVHPQHWTPDIDTAGKRVVVIGSGATAMTLVPSIAAHAAHVTMLQRSPTYVVARPASDALANRLRRHLPAMAAYRITRWKNVFLGMFFYRLSRRRPELVKQRMIAGVRHALGPDYDVATHFTPSYKPWDQRVCLVPDGDLFDALNSGRASVVTDHIASFTESGLLLKSGARLDADIVVTATGLNLEVLGGIRVAVDGVDIDLSRTMNYKGMMFSDVPNLASSFGYTNASWTLKSDLTAMYVCRLLKRMDRTGMRQCTPRRSDPAMAEEPALDFTSGYVQRGIGRFPKQGAKAPWKLYQNYLRDLLSLRWGKVDDGEMHFGNPGKDPVRGL
ncbi:Predicted flavoprotein CzcO associated with the cation diffusion facilitator CzcD [Noviherbaspirillum suwonense]|uniref:Predicted flavoprotein CzcO associated with the cation diffusion facilitator CzcD n=1 Tax=Noviherbaspirillum suwonense TaxID=1224511 RepID=A0ABY1QL78_9BURK|nr:Predicted flavoprotein CzcO associated with the cation diffusion facilitator CzcD [Noviherbaspirillum suwonense]